MIVISIPVSKVRCESETNWNEVQAMSEGKREQMNESN